MTQWRYKTFEQLSVGELYDILKLRQDVFIIEQQCIYPDIDDVDKAALHLFARSESDGSITAYLRILTPGIKFEEVALGRVLIHESSRGSGLGRALMQAAIQLVAEHHPGHAIKISAQQYLERLYNELHFVTVSEPYDEDGIMHIDMLRDSVW